MIRPVSALWVRAAGAAVNMGLGTTVISRNPVDFTQLMNGVKAKMTEITNRDSKVLIRLGMQVHDDGRP